MTTKALLFLLVWDSASRTASVEELGHDIEPALARLNAKERELNGSADEVVLFEADSLESLKRSHSSYFGTTATPTLPAA